MKDKFILKDSGKREEFKSGMVRDTRVGKGRYDLMSPFALERVAKIFEKGATKYGDRNWEKGAPFSRTLDSAIRHIMQYMMGMKEEDHLAQAAWNICAIMHLEKTKPWMDDMPHYLREKEPNLNRSKEEEGKNVTKSPDTEDNWKNLSQS